MAALPAVRGWALSLLLLALLCSMSLPAQAQWKWRDKDGRVTVSDRPPPRDVAEQDILGRPHIPATRGFTPPIAGKAAAPAAAAPGTAPASAPTALEREVQARRRAAEEEKAAKAKADEAKSAARRADNCRIARGQLAGLESGQRLSRLNEKGEREVLDDRARAQEAARAREVIASDCS